MKIYSLQKNKTFTQLVDFGDAILSRTKGALPKLTTGFTLVETLVSISIFTMSILGLMSVLASGISDSNYAKQKMTAEYLAQEGIEYVRNIRDTNVLYNTSGAQVGWTDFTNLSNTNITPPNPSDSSFSRTIIKTPAPGTVTDEVKITSTVTWNQGSIPKSVILSENLFNWIE
jgi:type II secretory pathway pseudopilin PulG